jgi:hypothetical protein
MLSFGEFTKLVFNKSSIETSQIISSLFGMEPAQWNPKLSTQVKKDSTSSTLGMVCGAEVSILPRTPSIATHMDILQQLTLTIASHLFK